MTSPESARPAIAASPAVSGVQLRVQCGNPYAPIKTIADGLKVASLLHPATLLVSGTCHENVLLEGLVGITLQGSPTATINGGSDASVNAVQVFDSQDIALSNLAITGGAGFFCAGLSDCSLTQVTIQNSLGAGASVNGGAHLSLLDCVIQNNAGAGLSVNVGAASLVGGQISNNGSDGVAVGFGGTFAAAPGDANDNATIQNNAGNGIRAALHNTVNLNSAVVTGNAVDGVALQLGSAMNVFSSTISNNSGHQIRIGDMSVVRFTGGPTNTVTGANAPDIACDSQFAATRQRSNAPGATTNCPAESPITP